MPTDPDVWVGLKRCGCCVAVCVENPEHKKEVEQTKRQFLRDGLSVVHGTWSEWETKYKPSMKRDCGHEPSAKTHDPGLSV